MMEDHIHFQKLVKIFIHNLLKMIKNISTKILGGVIQDTKFNIYDFRWIRVRK